MVQGTRTHNYEFNSIEEAISAENENIIQRYARKNNRSTTWVKNKLAEDSDFLVKERRKGKASQDLDFFDYLSENAENRDLAESETVEERELTNREILASALESTVKTEADRRTLRQYKRRAKALDAIYTPKQYDFISKEISKHNEKLYYRGTDERIHRSVVLYESIGSDDSRDNRDDVGQQTRDGSTGGLHQGESESNRVGDHQEGEHNTRLTLPRRRRR